METRRISTGAALVFSCLAPAALARDWLHNPSADTAPYTAMLAKPFVNYGTRAQVRIIRPDGVYLLGQDYYRYGIDSPGNSDRKTSDD
jgi:hypothetical protein